MANPVNISALISSANPAVEIIDGKPTTTSLEVARVFGKRHDDVLKAIRKLLSDLSGDHLRNFAETVITRENPSGGAPIASKAYHLTRDGLTLLAMGFTGKKARAFQVAYIDAFNRMEQELQGKAAATQNITAAQPELAFDPTDAAQLRDARAAALDYFDKAREAIKTGGTWPETGDMDNILRGLLANALKGKQWAIAFDHKWQMSLHPVPKNSLGDMAKRISNGDLLASSEELLQLGQACREKLVKRLSLPQQPDTAK